MLEPPRAVTAILRDIPYVRALAILVTNNGFGRSTVPNRDRTDHGNATKHHNQTELERMHDSVAVVCRNVENLNERMGGHLQEAREEAELISEILEGAINPLLGDGPAQ